MINFFNQGWVGILVGILCTALAYFLGQRRPIPKVTIVASHELTWNESIELPEGLEVSFHGIKIPHISRGLVTFWNGGNDVLNGDQIPKHDPLRIEIPDGQFLVISKVKESNSVNLCSVELDQANPKIAYINFDFLNPGDGLVIGFLHSSKQVSPNFCGTVKGGAIKFIENKIRNTHRRRLSLFTEKFLKISPYIFLTAGVILISFALVEKTLSAQVLDFLMQADVRVYREISNSGMWFLICVGLSYLATGGFQLWKRRKKYPRSLHVH